MKILIVVLLLAGCSTTPDLPEEVQDADGIGGATGKVEVVKWLGKLIMTAVTNVTVQVKVETKGEK